MDDDSHLVLWDVALQRADGLRRIEVLFRAPQSPTASSMPGASRRRAAHRRAQNVRLVLRDSMKPNFAAAVAILIAGTAVGDPTITLTHLRGNVYVVQEDYPLSDENAAVYVGKDFVTVVGATFSPESARLLAGEIAKVTSRPIREV